MKKNDKMSFKIGSPVKGANFFPRTDVTTEIRNAMRHDHVLLLAPRRTGKTSLLHHIADNSEEHGDAFYINLEKYETPDQWIAAMMACLLSDRRFHSLLSSINKKCEAIVRMAGRIESVGFSELSMKIRESVGKDWRRTAEDFLLRLTKTKRSIIFFLDEFPVLVKHIEKKNGDVESMLRWFRDWRQNHETGQVKFLVTGSIGLSSVVRRLRLEDTVNDFHSVSFPPLSRKEALEFMDRLSLDNGFQLSPSIKENILELLGPPWPYFLQIFLLEIYNWDLREKKPLTVGIVKQIYRERMIAGVKNKFLPHMFGRLREIFSPEEVRLARAILQECSAKKKGLKKTDFQRLHSTIIKDDLLRDEEQLGYVLDVLKHDGYIVQSTGGEQRTRFFSNMLRDYWKRRVAG